MYALTETIEELLGPLSHGGSINAMAHCPLHEDRHASLSVHQEDGVWKCHSCGASGGIEKLAQIVGTDLGMDFYWDRAIASVSKVPHPRRNFSVLANKLYQDGLTGNGAKAIISYMRNRNIGIDAHHHFWMGWTGSAISLPYWEDDSRKQGTVNAIKYRAANGFKWSEEDSDLKQLYNVEEVRGASKVLICEGESDTHVAWSHLLETEWRVAGVSGASIGVKTWERFALDLLWAERIAVCLDADKAGDDGAALAIDTLGEKAFRVRPEDGLDLTDHFKKYRRLPDGLED